MVSLCVRQVPSPRTGMEPLHTVLERSGSEDDGFEVQHKRAQDVRTIVDGLPFVSNSEREPRTISKILRAHSKDADALVRESTEEGERITRPAAAPKQRLQKYNSVDNFSSRIKSPKPLVDVSRGIVSQVGHLGEAYDEWVHDPMITKETPRFFDNNFAEYFTRTRWWVIPMVWCPVTFWMFSMALRNGMTVSRMPSLLFLGLLFWTLLEYVIHRYLFHMKTSSFWGNTLHYTLHGFHHKFPMDGARLVMPPAIALPIVIGIWLMMGDWLAPFEDRLVLYGGSILSYVCYDLIHYFLHFGNITSAHVKSLKRYHMIHHFKDHTHGYGITSSFWDYVFATVPAAAAGISKLSGKY